MMSPDLGAGRPRHFAAQPVAVILALGVLAACFDAPRARAEPPAEPGLAALAATRARPLFVPSRRPPPPRVASAPPPEAADPVAPPAPPPDLQLSGIVIGSQQMAIVKRPQDPSAVTMRVGGAVDGWTITAIAPRAIVLARDGRSVTIQLPAQGH